MKLKAVIDAINASDILSAEGRVMWYEPQRAVFFFDAGLRVDIEAGIDDGFTVVYGGIITEHATSAEVVVEYLENLDD